MVESEKEKDYLKDALFILNSFKFYDGSKNQVNKNRFSLTSSSISTESKLYRKFNWKYLKHLQES